MPSPARSAGGVIRDCRFRPNLYRYRHPGRRIRPEMAFNWRPPAEISRRYAELGDCTGASDEPACAPMMLSIREAAALVGKSPRTIREHARTGRIDARRIGGRWLIPRDAVADDATHRARQDEVERLRDHIDAALDEVTPGGRGYYSVRDVKSFEVMSTVRDALERIERVDGIGRQLGGWRKQHVVSGATL
ncbi:MAG: helix-turn-helix domain-containing protein [bacterium]